MIKHEKILAFSLSIFLLFFSLYCLSFSDQAVWSYNQNNLSRIIVIWQEDEDIHEIHDPGEAAPYLPVIKIYP